MGGLVNGPSLRPLAVLEGELDTLNLPPYLFLGADRLQEELYNTKGPRLVVVHTAKLRRHLNILDSARRPR